MDDAKPKVGLEVVVYAVIAGFLYGLAVRFRSHAFPQSSTFQVMSLFHGVPSDRHRVHHGFLDRAAAAATSLETEQIPPTTLDEHVTVGGKFFDVLHGEYTLEALHSGSTRLHLVSRHRVSTDFKLVCAFVDGRGNE
jgi:hypothetical protein